MLGQAVEAWPSAKREIHLTMPLKIAFVHDGLYPYFKGGAERRYYELARGLAQRHQVHYITWQYWEGGPRLTMESIRLHGVGRAMPFYGSDGKRIIKEALAFATRLTPVLLRERFDVIDCSATPCLPSYACWAASRFARIPVVVTWHEFWGDYWLGYLKHRPGLGRIARLVEAGSIPLADAVVSVSKFTALKLQRRLPAHLPLEVVENGINLAYIDDIPPGPEGIDIIFAGRLIDDKKLDLLLEAVAKASRRVPGLNCAIIGEGPERRRLEVLTQELGLQTQVRFLGFVEEHRLYRLMKGAKVFALPSVREGFGMAVIEAQACGLVPVVARAPYSAASFLIRDGVDGIVCDPDVDSLAQALAGLLEDDSMRRAMSAQARVSAARRDWSLISTKMEQVYLNLVSSRRNGGSTPSLSAAGGLK